VLGEDVDAAHGAVLSCRFSVLSGWNLVSQMVGRKAKMGMHGGWSIVGGSRAFSPA
jgi:hypothetical protein